MDRDKIFSIGIDIGTSTLQIIFSELIIENTAAAYLLPDFKITDKRVIYSSPIYFTPLKNVSELDLIKIRQIITEEFINSKLKQTDIATGAIIITGEAANKENADEAARQLAEFAGDFVVAVAGPDLEAQLAGFGSGAVQLAVEKKAIVANLDIGGGTTNVAVFREDELLDLYGLHIGGRLIRFNSENNVVYVSEKLQPLLDEMGLTFELYEKFDEKKIQLLCKAMAKLLCSVLLGKELSEKESKLQIYHGNKSVKLDFCTISGGVGKLVNKTQEEFLHNTIPFGDIGYYLASAIKEVFKENNISLLIPKETIRATVIGAGAHSMRLSGSTIYCDTELLPLKNVPVVSLSKDEIINKGISLAEIMQKKYALYNEVIAFYLELPIISSYSEIKNLAVQLWRFYEDNDMPILLLMKADTAKVLGQALRITSKHERKMICVDGLSAQQGDYIDFCHSMGASLLVTIKTLLFKN